MPARVMLSSVTKDDIPLGDTGKLKDFWYDAPGLADRLKQSGVAKKADSRVDFTFARAEIQQHLTGKYGFDVYNFQSVPSDGGSPEQITVLESQRSDLILGIFGANAGWTVPDQDSLTPTFREWRAALERPLKFKVYVFAGSFSVERPPALEAIVQAITSYKKGTIYREFKTLADLFAAIDLDVRDYLNKAMIQYARDYAARQPDAEKERWQLLPYRDRVIRMREALESVARLLGVKDSVLTFGPVTQPVELHCAPDNFSIPESKKFAAYIFDDEAASKTPGGPGPLHIVAAFGNITDLQVRRHLGNFEAAEVYSAPWGFYAAVPSTGVQCVYLPRCSNSLVMQANLSGAISWLSDRVPEISALAARRSQILSLGSSPATQTVAGTGGSK